MRAAVRLSPLGLVVTALALACACGGRTDEPSAPATPLPPPPPPPGPILAARPVATRAAFDLVALPDGAALAWAVPLTEGGGVRVVALDPLGAARGHEVVVARHGMAASAAAEQDPGQIEEIALAAAGMRVAIGWVARSGAILRAQATIASAGVDGFAPVRDLGAAPVGAIDLSTRGRLAAWGTRDGAAMIAHRMPSASCTASRGECARFGIARLGDDGGGGDGSSRASHVNEVSAPCDPLIVGGLARGEAWFYGTCHVSEAAGGPATTLFAIDPGTEGEGALASAPDVLTGCEPLGIAPGARGAIAVGRCPEGPRVQEMNARGELVGAVHAAVRSVRCAEGRPVIEVGGPGGPLRVPLTESASRLESLLPEAMAPAGARAVWTGDAMLIAIPSGRDVGLRRYQCELDRMVRSDVR